jgi:homoserine dehydrogenase
VPFLGTFERRALVARASGVTAILNGTSNYILTTMTRGGSFEAALADAQRLGYAEPDPSMDLSGADAAEKLTILIRLFGRLLVDPREIPLDGLGTVEADDIAAASAFGGALRPVSRASWRGTAIRAHVGPAFLDGTHPLARVAGVTNGVVIDAERGVQCYIGPGAGPDVTAATLLDDVSEIVTERRVRTPPSDAVQAAESVTRPESAWFLRLAGSTRPSDIADLLGSYGIWCTRLERRGDRAYAVTCAASEVRLQAALGAVQAATGAVPAAFPALSEEAHS